MGVLVGGEKAWKTRRTGDLCISYQWVNEEPAMLLFPKNPSSMKSGAYAICLSSAWRYADSQSGAPTPYLIQQADVAAEVLGLLPTKDTIRQIATVIIDGLPDLIDMPPEPAAINPLPKGEMSLKVDGTTIAHVGNA